MSDQHQEIKISDYKKPEYEVGSIYLDIDLYETKALVRNTMVLKRTGDEELFLHGKELKLESLKVNGEKYDYELLDEGIKLKDLPENCELEIVTEIYPQTNTSCEGLYKSGDIFCTQCEAEGFRKITYYFDRPDMMSVFTTKITADKKAYPYLLSNGNKVESGELDDNRHWAVWSDPHKKPSYLFALVAGDLALIEDSFQTMSGKDVALQIFVDHGNEDKCDHAMRSLKKSMKWDEEVFGLEYDLDIYMIVAVDSFNMGAMENKGLNIFNSVYVLAKQETAIDEEFLGIEAVIGHEYFHNWTGNRVTCRDWFQLTLKEGLTVFRDQEFSADMFDRTVQRIMDVTRLKEAQFPEDKGPMAHPIKPKSYIEINNFYTATIYEKGAEVIRMIHTLIGADNFRKGMDKYFELFDGQAVRTQDFSHAMEQASGVDLDQFQRWYDYAGTPTLNINTNFKDGQFEIKITQSIPEQGNELLKLEPLHIPFRFALNGEAKIVELKEWETTMSFKMEQLPICEWNLNFSAPVYINDDLGILNLKEIVKNGSSPFSRWEAFQSIVFISLKQSENSEHKFDDIIETLRTVLESDISNAVKAKFLSLSSEVQLNGQLDPMNPQFVNEWREGFFKVVSSELGESIKSLYDQAQEDGFSLSAESIGKRSLRGKCLSYLAIHPEYKKVVYEHYINSTNMSDQYRSLSALVLSEHEKSDEVLDSFYQQWKHDGLVINKWFSVQTQRKGAINFKKMKALESNESFDWSEPNKVRALYGGFAMGNLSEFHQSSGDGYKLIADVIRKLDVQNPQVGSRIATSFRDATKLPANQKEQLTDILKDLSEELKSPNCTEIIGKTLGALSH